MSGAVRVSDHPTRAIPAMLLPNAEEALREALVCLDSAGQALHRGHVGQTDEVLALLQAAATHLETAWEGSADKADVAPPTRGRR